jgi:hypothetical protein
MRAALSAILVIALGCAKPTDPPVLYRYPYGEDEPTRPEVDRSGVGMFFDLLQECSESVESPLIFHVRHEICAQPDQPGATETAEALERCRSKLMTLGKLDLEEQYAQLAAPLDLRACPPPPPVLTELPPSTWTGPEGEMITVVLSNLCACQIEFGFTRLGDPVTEVRNLPPLSRQQITIPRGFGLQPRHLEQAAFGAWCGTDVDGGQVWIPWHGHGCQASDGPEVPEM